MALTTVLGWVSLQLSMISTFQWMDPYICITCRTQLLCHQGESLFGSKDIFVRTTSFQISTVMSHKHYGVSNHRQPDYLFNNLLKLTWTKTPKPCCGDGDRGTSDRWSPHKEQVMAKAFPWLEPLCWNYRKVSNIRRTKFQNLRVSCPVLQLSWPNLLKPCIKSRMKM